MGEGRGRVEGGGGRGSRICLQLTRLTQLPYKFMPVQGECPGFIGFHRVFIGFHRVSTGLIGFHQVFIEFSSGLMEPLLYRDGALQ